MASKSHLEMLWVVRAGNTEQLGRKTLVSLSGDEVCWGLAALRTLLVS